MKYAIFILCILCSAFLSTKAWAQCDATEAFIADKAVDNLQTWQAVYKSYRKYHACDDGVIAEGYSDSVVKLLANHWSEFPVMRHFITADPAFYQFVLSHIDATTDWDDLKNVATHAFSDCPKNAAKVCLAIERKASSAYKEARSYSNPSPL